MPEMMTQSSLELDSESLTSVFQSMHPLPQDLSWNRQEWNEGLVCGWKYRWHEVEGSEPKNKREHERRSAKEAKKGGRGRATRR